MKRFQIRDGSMGRAIYEADDPADALALFIADKAKAAARRSVMEVKPGTAAVIYQGVRFEAVEIPG